MRKRVARYTWSVVGFEREGVDDEAVAGEDADDAGVEGLLVVVGDGAEQADDAVDQDAAGAERHRLDAEEPRAEHALERLRRLTASDTRRTHIRRSTQPYIPPGSLNRVPASAGLRAGMSPLPGGR